MKKLLALTLATLLLGCAGPVQHRAEGVDVAEPSSLARLVPAKDLENAANQQYAQMMQDARNKKTLALDTDPQLQRLRRIAQRLIPQALAWNAQAKAWRWEVNLISGKQLNAFCMPGGKIAFYTGLLDQLKLTDDEVAVIMGHEMTHALREHARARIGKTNLTNLGVDLFSRAFGLGQVGQTLTGLGGQLLTLNFSRDDESEADLIGLELMARAGFNPQAGVSLWKKMAAQSKDAPPQWMSTHPSDSTRISEIEKNLPKVMPLYEKAQKQ